jgi:hypothetical protein
MESGAGRESWMQKERDDTLALIRAQLSNPELEEALGHGRNLTVGEAATLAIAETHASSR